jgi:D-alanyl-D-alanine carboxypeptidase
MNPLEKHLGKIKLPPSFVLTALIATAAIAHANAHANAHADAPTPRAPTAPATAANAFEATARLQTLLSSWGRENMAMGAVAYAQADEPVWAHATGFARVVADAQPPAAANAATRYRIGSISKLLTAIMVMQLAEEGRLKLDEPIQRWFPTLPLAASITIADLLSHRSGLGDIKDLPNFDAQWMFEPRAEGDLLRAITSLPRAFAPGARMQYNNSGYLLLSFIVEKAGGQPYAHALQQRIAGPLGLQHMSFDAKAGLKPNEAISYRWTEAGSWQAVRATDPSVPLGAGGVVASPGDLVRVIRALFGGKFINAQSLALMTQQREGFGLGITTWQTPGGLAFGHEGVIDGFGAMLAYIPATRTALAWCGNAYRLPRDVAYTALYAAAMRPEAQLPSYTVAATKMRFEVTLPPHGLEAAPAAVHLRGNAEPLSWAKDTPLQFDAQRGVWRADVTLQLREGMPFEYKYLIGPRWERTNNRRFQAPTTDLPSAQPLTVRDNWEYDTARTALRDQVLASDAQLFGALAARRIEPMRTGFSTQLEFFHDRTGLTDYAHNIAHFERALASGKAPKRELMPGSEVFALGDYGALHQGWHRFCADGNCSAYRFTHLWQKQSDGGLKLHRVISYDH